MKNNHDSQHNTSYGVLATFQENVAVPKFAPRSAVADGFKTISRSENRSENALQLAKLAQTLRYFIHID